MNLAKLLEGLIAVQRKLLTEHLELAEHIATLNERVGLEHVQPAVTSEATLRKTQAEIEELDRIFHAGEGLK